MYSVVVKQSQADRERGNERKEERKRERENWLLLDSFRRCSSSSCHFSIRREQSHLGPCEQVTGGAGGWRRPLLTRAGVSRGDRSKELLTGGSWHRTAPGPRDAASAHLSTGNWNGNAWDGKKLCVSFRPCCSVTLFCYFTNPRVKDSQRHEILMRPDVSHIAFCCKGASARELSADSLWRYTGIEVLDL